MQIRDHPGKSKSALVETNGSVGRTKLTRINELVEAGLVETRKGDNKWNAMKVYLTPEGQETVACIQEISDILDKLPSSDSEE